MTGIRPRRLLGRHREQEQLARLLSQARGGHSATIVVRGDPGVGKTSILDYLIARAADFRVLRIRGSESEMELAYAGLHQLCTPLLNRLDRLPVPQQRALQVALGVADGDPPDRLIVGLALLTLMSEASAERPTLCVIDDAQWVDAESLRAVAFAARRLDADPTLIVFAACQRREDRILNGLAELQLRGLADDDARALLTRTMPGEIDEQVRENILAESRGNPLALLELHRVFTPAELAGGFGLANADQLAGRLRRSFDRRLADLPAHATTLLLVAAADPTGDPRWLAGAADHLGLPEDAADMAVDADLISIDSRVCFRHPMIRSVVYRNAGTAERRRAHRALAAVIDGPSATEHLAWHLGHASAGPDEHVAAQLESAAGDARKRGGVAAAAAFLAFASSLTPDPQVRVERALAAAQAKLDTGAPQSAAALLVDARRMTDDDLTTARIDRLRARAVARPADAVPLLMQTAGRLADAAPELARENVFEALSAAIQAGRMSGPTTSAVSVAGAARPLVGPLVPQRAVDVLLCGLIVRMLDGYVDGAVSLKKAMQEFLRLDADATAEPQYYDMATRICLELFDFDAFETLALRQHALLAGAGALATLPPALGALATAEIFSGRLADAAAHLSEAEAIATAIGGPQLGVGTALLTAFQGQEKATREIVVAITEDADKVHGHGYSVGAAMFASAVLHNSLGQYGEALNCCRAALAYDDIGITNLVLVELIEAASRSAETAAAGEALTRLVERAEAGGTTTALGLAARARALLTEGSEAEAEYRSAIAHLEGSTAVVYLARTYLVYGEWLRRQGRRMDARAALHRAEEMFSEMGAEGFADRCRRELEATGEAVRRRDGGPVVELTGQESHIARLAAEGRTNSEIAAQLFISARTVEWHLSKIFSKLGVASRKELRSRELPPP
ncbi:LuxR family transcriptional regulator [Mycolicibacterium smegmatis]|uniref:LuxR family transcriptional regulator n=1 Tax=Mycolicibacterium smegmatis TaxID=1772 RepID=UPI0005D85A98|nr:LuxR family transcriptional regulator [Mycolicibacterium smegmatis]MCP2625245.1 LuxR family transcriptional regulator [Mycolicibacterium smegmatis]MDF1899231.1 LuxR family transcriptional regulator [Mycolicibacterium smegmatis]MDF1904643.1 LuxR family transcriptional regulator [Mycolicibacterium smegmatis]MDF1918512.1 LuxR family transcriptional regulator [Mycolicibacterium smegmatis]MDF1923807.1 LuxR family transcriptional regulator [Mycolicibacterium smegmatis]